MAGVEDVDKDIKPANVVDNINDKTPDPETPAPVSEELDNTPEPPRSDKEGMAELREMVQKMGDTVTGLSDTVTKVVEMVTANRDENPGGNRERERKPWTHFGSRNRE